MKLTTFPRIILSLLFRKYDIWRIYSRDLLESSSEVSPITILPIDDLAIFNAPGLEDELRRAEWYRPGAIGFAAWSDTKLAGVCWLWPGPLLGERNVGIQNSDSAELIQITVASWCRRMGIGQALIKHATSQLREMGYKRLYAQIWWTNKASVHAFLSCGWKHVAWFLQFDLRLLSRPWRFRIIRSPFPSNPEILGNWRKSRPFSVKTAERNSEDMQWQIANQSLRLTISDLNITEYRFRALVSETPIAELIGMVEPPLPPRESQRSGLAGAVIRNFPFVGKLDTFRRIGPWLRYVPLRYTRSLVERKGTFEEYLGGFSSKSRKNVRRSVRKFEEAAGGCCWREYRTVEDVGPFHQLAAAISERTYQTRLFNEGVACTEDVRRLLEKMAANDQLRGYVLFLGDEPVAFALCERKGSTLLYKTIGYAPEHRERSPGTVLLWYILQRFFADAEFRYLDFGEGEGFYKEFFSNLTLDCARIYYFRARPVLLLVVAIHRGWNLAVETLARMPGMMRLVRGMRRTLRRHAEAALPEHAKSV
jgi:GNAT superfamily N-acetyltransferase